MDAVGWRTEGGCWSVEGGGGLPGADGGGGLRLRVIGFLAARGLLLEERDLTRGLGGRLLRAGGFLRDPRINIQQGHERHARSNRDNLIRPSRWLEPRLPTTVAAIR